MMGEKRESSTLLVERTLTRYGKTQKQEVSQEPLEVSVFQSEPARVKLELGGTFGIGQYESVRVLVGIEMPCYPEEHAEVFAFVKNIVKERLDAEVKEIRRFAKGRKPF